MDKLSIYKLINKEKKKVNPTLLSIFDKTKTFVTTSNHYSNGVFIINKNEGIIKQLDVEKLKSRKNYTIRDMDSDFLEKPKMKECIKNAKDVYSIKEMMRFVEINGNKDCVFDGDYFRFLKKYRNKILVANDTLLLFYKNDVMIGGLLAIVLATPEVLKDDMTVEEYKEFKKEYNKNKNEGDLIG